MVLRAPSRIEGPVSGLRLKAQSCKGTIDVPLTVCCVGLYPDASILRGSFVMGIVLYMVVTALSNPD